MEATLSTREFLQWVIFYNLQNEAGGSSGRRDMPWEQMRHNIMRHNELVKDAGNR